MTTTSLAPGARLNAALNTRGHRLALCLFAAVVIIHWGEHLSQAVQIYALGWPPPKSNGLIGSVFPWLVHSEWLHYGFAILMLIGFVLLRHGFVGRARRWWDAALWIQVWHHFEHLLLLLQALTGSFLMDAAKPTSIVQLVVPRVELHLFYNTVVTIPMIVAMYYHLLPNAGERAEMQCSCAGSRQPAVAGPA